MSKTILSNEDFLLIARDLEIHHSVFSKLWNIGKPSFTDKIPTACVTFDKEGNHLGFLFNPDFWDSQTPYERNFIICHECLHIILNHGLRLKDLDRDVGNISADVVINEMLLSGFGFDRDKLDWISKNGCWLNTVFKDRNPPAEPDKSLEYYYNLFPKAEGGSSNEQGEGAGGSKSSPQILDDHEGFKGINPKDVSQMLEEILEGLNDSEKESLEKSFKDGNSEESEESSKVAGSLAGQLKIKIDVKNVKKKRKWETVIKKWATNFIKQSDKDHEQWARVNRRFVGIASSMHDVFLPSEMEIDERENEKRKIKVVFFQDTSGSCVHLAERFFKAAKSLPTDRFEVELYCFDTRCYKTSLQTGELYGFGGTSFSVLEAEVMKICGGDLKNYPKAIFVITDGYGNSIHPRKPKNWYWFLSTNYTSCISKECNIFNLNDFE